MTEERDNKNIKNQSATDLSVNKNENIQEELQNIDNQLELPKQAD